jgi:hypothetical protein
MHHWLVSIVDFATQSVVVRICLYRGWGVQLRDKSAAFGVMAIPLSNNSHGQTSGISEGTERVPLTPALSQRERELNELPLEAQKVLLLLARQRHRLPLQRGEGWGEGEVARSQRTSSIFSPLLLNGIWGNGEHRSLFMKSGEERRVICFEIQIQSADPSRAATPNAALSPRRLHSSIRVDHAGAAPLCPL